MSEKHTPGPWRVDETVALGAYGVWADCSDTESGIGQICSVYPNNKSDFPREQRDANARLIADAPTMLRLLREVVSDKKEIGDTLTEIRELLERHGGR